MSEKKSRPTNFIQWRFDINKRWHPNTQANVSNAPNDTPGNTTLESRVQTQESRVESPEKTPDPYRDLALSAHAPTAHEPKAMLKMPLENFLHVTEGLAELSGGLTEHMIGILERIHKRYRFEPGAFFQRLRESGIQDVSGYESREREFVAFLHAEERLLSKPNGHSPATSSTWSGANSNE
jgi:hypothetical protein